MTNDLTLQTWLIAYGVVAFVQWALMMGYGYTVWGHRNKISLDQTLICIIVPGLGFYKVLHDKYVERSHKFNNSCSIERPCKECAQTICYYCHGPIDQEDGIWHNTKLPAYMRFCSRQCMISCHVS